MDRNRLLIRTGYGLVGLGFAMWVIGGVADEIGLGGQPGFNQRQIALAEAGLAVMLAGVLATGGLDGLRAPRRWLDRRRDAREGRAERAPAGLRRLAGPEGAVAAAVLGFLAVTAWWLSQDGRVPNGDSGRHLILAHNYFVAIKDGSLASSLSNPGVIDNEFYPPLGHLVGAVGASIAGFSPSSAILAENLVFVPLLALGCYGAGRAVFGRRAGALAAMFALSVPILVSQWHVFQLDAPQAALVAVGVWMLLLSRRFEHVGYSAVAGAAVGLATMTKVTSPLFLIGFVAVMLVRGGWRNWRGAAVFALMTLLIAEPWLLDQEDLIRPRSEGAVGGATSPGAEGESGGNYAAYFRVALGVQYYLPLCLLFVVGAVASTRSWIAERKPDQLPELLIGVVVAYLGLSSLSYFDPRYSLPALVFLAVLGTGWIVSLPRRAQTAMAGLVVALLVVNTVMISTGLGGDVAVDPPVAVDRAVLVSDLGYFEARPIDSDGYRELFARARQDGIENVLFDGPSLNVGGTNLNGLATLAFTEDLGVKPGFDLAAIGPRDMFMLRAPVGQAPGMPCITVPDGQGVYLYRGAAPGPDSGYCP